MHIYHFNTFFICCLLYVDFSVTLSDLWIMGYYIPFMATKMERCGDRPNHIASKGGCVRYPALSFSIKSTYRRAGPCKEEE